MPFDIVFHGAQLIDGTGNGAIRADLAIKDARIVAIDEIDESADARRHVDADGLVLAPGFIDIHTHSDLTCLLPDAGVNKLSQGVTTEVVGNCGFSPFPLEASRIQAHREHLLCLGPDEAELRWTDFDGYRQAVLASRPMFNVAALVGHGTLRMASVGLSPQPLDRDQAALASRLLSQSLEQGALGLSTGLTYVPSQYASTEELIDLSKICTSHSAVYATHARGLAGKEFTAVDEAVRIGRESGVRVEYSHLSINTPGLWGQAQDLLARFDAARQSGVDIGFDVYPYDASASSISQYLPEWLVQLGLEEARQALRSEETRRKALVDLAAGWYGGIPWMWDRVMVTHSGPGDLESPGCTIEELAKRRDRAPEAVTLNLYESFGNAVQVAMFYRLESDMVEFLRHPLSTIGSDGIALPRSSLGSKPHPRFFGTFPRVLGRYVRDQSVMSLVAAIRKMTGEPADRLGLADVGYLRKGLAADVVAIRADAVGDRATFSQSNLLSSGIRFVVVNGEVVWEEDRWTGARPGRVLVRGETAA